MGTAVTPIAVVQALKKQLTTAVAADNADDIKRVLNQLKSDIVVSEELIRETKIGVTVGKLRQNSNKSVVDLAKEIVRKWKTDVGQSGSKKADTASQNSSNVASPSPAPASPAPSKTESKPTKHMPPSSSSLSSSTTSKATDHKTEAASSAGASNGGGASLTRRESNGAPRTHVTDGLDFFKDKDATGDRTRDKCAEMIYDALASDSAAPIDLIQTRARALEKHVHSVNPPPEGTNAYRQKMRSLYLNLKAANNPSLREDVVSGEISVKRLSEMSAAEMASEEQQAINRKLVEENLFKAQGAAPQQAETDAFQCGKCKQRKTMYYQMQTRSADEPMTTFVTCLNCKAAPLLDARRQGAQANVISVQATIAGSLQTNNSLPTVRARLGNFIKSSANYSCDPVQAIWDNVVPPATISLYSGRGLPQAFFTSKPTTNESYINFVETIAVVNDTSGSVPWPVDINTGSYVGFAIQDSRGLMGFSELRTVYEGSRGDPTCRAVIDDPALSERNYSLPLVGSYDTNIYLPTATVPCQMPIQYSMSYKPGRLEAFNATGLPMRFFQGETDGVNVNIIETIAANLSRYSMGTEYWTPNVPIGTRMGFKLTDGRGQVAYSEVRTVYEATENTRRTCET
ncbi:transcription elongation factor TFIIS [Microbotryomycetes sp. JL201]|nr:transcription elongation factor TFIIS [Microbotryomycetes sp. JL201]